MDHVRWRFDGWIAGVGTSGGTRLVTGHWPGSPFGPVTDVMVERPDGHRLLLAETAELARFVAETYTFDEVRVVPVTVDRSPAAWTVTAGPLRLHFTTGGRGLLGHLLHAVPAAVAQDLRWVRLIDLPARLLRGVRTHGSAGNGRREWYAVRDLHRITAAGAVLDGADLGRLAPVDPPVRFGFGSAPRSPALVRITTTVEVPSGDEEVARHEDDE
ncbi:hypothetical protein Aph02nite_84070 [Actinoplanes philippinensis]|uniref:Uncharacterized protein n=1 Tax=Actinoplanes philippinensis TaxID=35752 RepID=A0A1I2L4R6_9ACTN|nr:hypothetical protein [Actinoplanes philippinensis]GIE82457.1 hypothetical protein Aph02nite_84070 [Actinoplanes philippinensis]SFF74332.1 hypothetical protein SAMN05421541_12034 [Actinoplanes philippinensis]